MMAASNMDLSSYNEPELPPQSLKRSIDTLGLTDDMLSSELFMFSSDSILSTIENYTNQRPKRQYQGTWWETHNKSKTIVPAPTKQRGLARNLDSGVWMGSDSDIEDEFKNTSCVYTNVLQEEDNWHKSVKMAEIEDDMIRRFDPRAEGVSDVQWEAMKQVDEAVVNSHSIIDLSRLYLEDLPWAILQPLETFTPVPQYLYAPLVSNLQIFLAQNNLSSLPEELFNLKGMTALGLRNNNLTALSPAIGKLASSLNELNLSCNKLNYLPIELKMGLKGSNQFFILRITDNPLYQPVQDTKNTVAGSTTFVPNTAPWIGPRSIYCSRVAYMGVSGQSINGPVPSRDKKASPMTTLELKQLPKSTKEVPSLYEIALRKSTEYPIETLLQPLGWDVPESLTTNLKNAAEQAKTGFQSCSICGRKFSIARTEWIEWQDDLPGYKKVPLLHRGCSWNCLPEVEHLDSNAKACGWSEGSGLKVFDILDTQ